MKVTLQYFKKSGKFYTEGSYESTCSSMYTLLEEIYLLAQHPGLIGVWREGPIYVHCDAEFYFPVLVTRLIRSE